MSINDRVNEQDTKAQALTVALIKHANTLICVKFQKRFKINIQF